MPVSLSLLAGNVYSGSMNREVPDPDSQHPMQITRFTVSYSKWSHVGYSGGSGRVYRQLRHRPGSSDRLERDPLDIRGTSCRREVDVTQRARVIYLVNCGSTTLKQ
jgi:hypothetical protein